VLARAASVATVVEPPLLRRLRQRVPGLRSATGQPLSAGVEADLWFSRLAHVATSAQLTLRPAVLADLRAELSSPAHQAVASAARAVVLDAHRLHSDMVQLEERVIWASIVGDVDDVGAALERALTTMRLSDRADEVVSWFLQARRRLPPAALAHPAGRRLLAAVALHVDRVVPPDLLTADRFPDAVGEVAPAGLPLASVYVLALPGGIRFERPEERLAARMEVPDTRPLLVEATWSGPDGDERRAVLRAEPGSTAALEGLDGAVVLRTLAGRRYEVRSIEARTVPVTILGRIFPTAEERRLEDQLTQAVDVPHTVVQVHRTADPRTRPEVIVLGDDVDVSEPPVQHLVDTFVRSADRAVAEHPHFTGSAAYLVRFYLGSPAYGRDLDRLVKGHRVDVHDVTNPAVLREVVVSAVQSVLRSPERMYALDAESARAVLNSVALAFHVREFHREVAPTDEQDRALFGLPAAPSSRSDFTDAAEAIYRHVKNHCEYLFAEPVRRYLSDGIDVTQVPVEVRPDSHVAFVDATGRTPYDLGWSPTGQAWDSFPAYLSWFVGQLVRLTGMLRDRLGAGMKDVRFSVRADAFESAQLALRPGALLPVAEQPPPRPARSAGLDRTNDATFFHVDRARLPEVIQALASPVLAAAKAVAARPPTGRPGDVRMDASVGRLERAGGTLAGAFLVAEDLAVTVAHALGDDFTVDDLTYAGEGGAARIPVLGVHLDDSEDLAFLRLPTQAARPLPLAVAQRGDLVSVTVLSESGPQQLPARWHEGTSPVLRILSGPPGALAGRGMTAAGCPVRLNSTGDVVGLVLSGKASISAQVLSAERLARAHERTGSARSQGDVEVEELAVMDAEAARLRWSGRAEEARRLDEETLTRRRAVLGPDHVGTLASASNLAADLRDLGDADQACALDEQVLDRRRSVLGPEHPDTLASMSNLAADYRRLGRIEEALELDEVTLTARQSVLGVAHPDTLASMSNLADDHQQAGRLTSALALMQQVVATMAEVETSATPLHVRRLRALAQMQEQVGDLHAAADTYSRAIRDAEQAFGAEHLEVASVLDARRQVEEQLGLSREAAASYARAERIRRLRPSPA